MPFADGRSSANRRLLTGHGDINHRKPPFGDGVHSLISPNELPPFANGTNSMELNYLPSQTSQRNALD
jgi:hypothetical protein